MSGHVVISMHDASYWRFCRCSKNAANEKTIYLPTSKYVTLDYSTSTSLHTNQPTNQTLLCNSIEELLQPLPLITLNH